MGDDIQRNTHELENWPHNVIINFDKLSSISFKAKEIVDSVITGRQQKQHKLNRHNLVRTSIVETDSDTTDWTGVDIKDSSFQNSKFHKVRFHDSAWMDSRLESVMFSNCSYKYTSISTTTFESCLFQSCDLSNMVFKGCYFYQCTFHNCTLSNKLSEMSAFYDCLFSGTDISIETIVENYGLQNHHFKKGKIDGLEISSEEEMNALFKKKYKFSNISPLSLFKIKYFFESDLFLNGNEILEELYVINNWIDISKFPSNFILQLELFHHFLNQKYISNSLPLIYLLKLHTLTYFLSENEVLSQNLNMYKGIMGIHLSLTREVELFLNTINVLFAKAKSNTNHTIEVIGPLTLDFYEDKLSDVLEGISLIKVEKKNSPNLLTIAIENSEIILPLLALFLSTRIEVEFKVYAIDPNNEKSMAFLDSKFRRHKNDGKDLMPIQNTTFSIGPKIERQYLYELKFQALKPNNLLKVLKLNLKFRKIVDMGKIVKALGSIASDSSGE